MASAELVLHQPPKKRRHLTERAAGSLNAKQMRDLIPEIRKMEHDAITLELLALCRSFVMELLLCVKSSSDGLT